MRETIEADKISLFFTNEFPFNKEGLDEFVNAFVIKKYKKGQIILQNNHIESELRFLDKGVVREYYRFNRKEKNVNFFTEPSFINDILSFTQQVPTIKFQECLTDIELRVLSREKFLYFTNKYSCGKLFIETIFQRKVMKKELEEYNFFIMTPEEMYLDIIQTKQNWLILIPQYHIASYLGVSPETLSRIRKRIF